MKTLIVIPTYNERENVRPMCEQIGALGLDADLLFIDDGSPDGTGALLDELTKEHPRLRVLHRPAKSGIGSAHQDGIALAYAEGYERLVTLDCDFTHSPDLIPAFSRAPRPPTSWSARATSTPTACRVGRWCVRR